MKSIASTQVFEQTIERSRFIGVIAPVEDELAVSLILEQYKALYPQANHYCYAYVIGANGQFQRASDDKEPKGTAGLPMLETLKNQEVTNVIGIVIRYFGGTLLGTGGLRRAYVSSLAGAMDQCQYLFPMKLDSYFIRIPYGKMGSLEGFLRQNVEHLQVIYEAENVYYSFDILHDLYEDLAKDVGKLVHYEHPLQWLSTSIVYR